MNSKTLQKIISSKSAAEAMATPQKMQHYMEKHRLGPLFENLMNKVLHDQPEAPLIYLIAALYKKAGLEVPSDLKYGRPGIRHSSPDKIGQRNRSPEMVRKSTPAWTSGPDIKDCPVQIDLLVEQIEVLLDLSDRRESHDKDRTYDKPWLSHSRKSRPKTADDMSPSKAASQQRHANKTFPCSYKYDRTEQKTCKTDIGNLQDLLIVQAKPLTPGRKPVKQSWNPDTKVQSTSFDDLFSDEKKETVKKTDVQTSEPRKNWATMGLEDDDLVTYTSGSFHGPKHVKHSDPLAGELMNYNVTEDEEKAQRNVKKGHVRGREVDTHKHQRQLKEMLRSADQHSDDSGYIERDEEDDAIELLEDADDLRNEGVTNISASGYKLSKIMKQRQEDAKVKLNINLFAGTMPSDSYLGNKYDSMNSMKSIDEFKGYDSDDERPPTGMSGFRTSPGDSDADEEFESVSQVTGPRRPVWNVGGDSDVETFSPNPSKKQPFTSQSRKMGQGSEKKFSATMPTRFEDSAVPSKSRESAESFLNSSPNKTWAPGNRQRDTEISRKSAVSVQESVRSDAGVWQIPKYDSDSSVTEWSQHTSKSPGKRPPRAY